MFNIRKMFNKKDNLDNKGFKIIYESGIVKSKVLSWCKDLGVSSFSQILMELGFIETDIVYLYENYGSLYRINYSVNEDKYKSENSIQFNYNKKEFIISNGCGNKCYSVDLLNDGKIHMSLDYYKRRISSNVICYHKYGNSSSLFIVDNGDYELTFEIYLVEDDSYCFSDIVDEDAIEKYLISLEFPIVIDDVYKKICKILKLDISMIEMLNLTVTKNVDRKKVDIVTDEILIQKGELCRVTKTNNGRRMTIDASGNWFYDKLDNNSVFSVKYNDNCDPKYRYSFKDTSESNDVYFSDNDLVELKNDADKEIENVKRLVRNMFDVNI